ncbi:helix-turn-helix domain-containing protein [Paenibacillus larvae]|uniref:helix-turn-helix domain-containing protein n=1 Tax=Paenibacillus larvae TaxID=1464 RepID=UPI0037C63263
MNATKRSICIWKGTSMKAIADILNRNRMTVSSYIHTYENGGLGCLANQAFLRVLLLGWTKQQQDRLKQTVAYSVPHEVGFYGQSTTGRLN